MNKLRKTLTAILHAMCYLITCFPDIDECLTGTHTCQEDATCNNTIGWYNCTCNPGFDGNGKNCNGKFYGN